MSERDRRTVIVWDEGAEVYRIQVVDEPPVELTGDYYSDPRNRREFLYSSVRDEPKLRSIYEQLPAACAVDDLFWALDQRDDAMRRVARLWEMMENDREQSPGVVVFLMGMFGGALTLAFWLVFIRAVFGD